MGGLWTKSLRQGVQNDFELTNRALRIAKFDKLIVAVFNVMVSAAPFVLLLLGAGGISLLSSVSLSLAVTFGFTMLYAIQTFSSFVNGESSALLSTLPIAQDDFSLITIFSFIRSVDYMVIGSILSQVVLTACLTLSPFATLVMLGASAVNAVLAVTVALWFAKVFQSNLWRGGRTKISTVLRLVFILMWGLLLVGVGFMFSIPWYIIPNLENVLPSIGQMATVLMSLVFPFSAGIIISAAVYSNVGFTTILVAGAAFGGYTLLAIVAGKWSLKTVKHITQGYGLKMARIATDDFSIKLHNPLSAYVLKDLKVSSRNPATAFFFALPVIETVIITLLISNLETLRTSALLVSTFMGGVFALLLPLALLSVEGKGLEYTKTLPLNSRQIIISKALVSTATYVPVPLALLGLALVKPMTSFSSAFTPFFITFAVASASIFEVKLFLGTVAKGKIAAVVSDFERLVVGVLTVLLPELAYAVLFLTTFDHWLSLLAMGGTALLELSVSIYTLRR